jgi:ABC-type Fe2+-enterobactin transport system substrate-binding protein
VPDPTLLTTQALLREIDGLKELLQSQLEALGAKWHEKFEAILKQLDMVEAQRIEQKQDTKTAVDAALQAQKEAVREQTTASERAIAKSETATTKQLEQLGTTLKTVEDGLRRDINGVKDRVTTIESKLLT